MKKVLVLGGSGLVGSNFIQKYSKEFEIKSPNAEDVDILKKDRLKRAFEESSPDVIINFAAFTDVEGAEEQKGNKEGICYLINAIGAKNVSEVSKELDKKLIHISTEYVFDGTKEDSPYTEEDKPNPINWYGTTKLSGEDFVLESLCRSTIVRISMPFRGFYKEKKDVARFFLEELKMSKKIRVVEDQRITPTIVSDISDALKQLVLSDNTGLFHVSGTDSVTPFEFAKTIAEIFRLDYSLISGIDLDEYNRTKKAKLLKYSWLNPTKFERAFGDEILHSVEEGLVIFKKEIDSERENRI